MHYEIISWSRLIEHIKTIINQIAENVDLTMRCLYQYALQSVTEKPDAPVTQSELA